MWVRAHLHTQQRNMAGGGTPISPSEPPAQLLPSLSQEDGQPRARCETSKLVNGDGSPHGVLPTGWGAISMGCQEEHFRTVGLTVRCSREGPKAGNGRDQGLGANKREETEG